MNAKSKQSKNDVFEMILQATSEQPAQVEAKPSNLELPEAWQENHLEGQLAVDVAQTDKEVVIVSTMAGAVADKIEVYLHNDLLTIRGQRSSPFQGEEYFYQECFWGKFSRTIVLPVDVKADFSKAEYNNGVLTIKIPKQKTTAQIPVVIVED